MKLYEDLVWRGLISQTAGEDIEDAVNSGNLTFYLGVDPTGKSVHVGSLLTIMGLVRLARAGHHPVILIGGATGMIGDPSGKSQERNLLDEETTFANSKYIENQIKKLVPEAVFVNNYDWISKMSVITFLRDIGKNLTVNYMMAKESVKRRLESGISYTEFSYQMIQACDFLHLYKEMGCALQVGGQDQWGNITAGFELIRKIEGSSAKVYCLTFPLLLKADGTKFGKTAEGGVWLDPDMTSPYSLYQFWLNTPDEDVIARLKEFTLLEKEEIDSIEEEWNLAREKRLAQTRLAEEVTKFVHGEEALKEAQRITEAVFKGDITSLSKKEIEDVFKEDQILSISDDKNILDILVEANLAPSKSEARKLVQGGAVSVNSHKIDDISFIVKKEDAIGNTYSFIKKGKKNHILLKHE